jgi:hypothetical protein
MGEQYGFDGKGRHAHGGMLRAALGIRGELEANDTLGRIFGGYDSNLQTPLREVCANVSACLFLVRSGTKVASATRYVLRRKRAARTTSWW